MPTYQEYYKYYKNKIEQNMKPVLIENTPEVQQLAVALQNYVKVKMAHHNYEIEQRAYEARLLQIREQAERDKDDDNGITGIFFTIAKIAALAAVAYFAPPLLAEALPAVGAVGTITNAAATGLAIGATDAAAQNVGIGLGVQNKFSFNEVLESAIAGGVGAGTVGLSTIPRAAAVATVASGTQAAEIALKLRENFDAKAVGLQIAASIIASGINKIMPELAQTFGENEGAQIAATTANTAINAVLQTAITGAPLDIANVAANIAGTVAGNKLGSAISDTIAHQQTKPQIKETSQNDVPEQNLDELDPVNDPVPVNDKNYLKNLKFTSIQSDPANDVARLIMDGKFEEAKALAIEAPKSQNASIMTNTNNLARTSLKSSDQNINQRLEKYSTTNIGNSTSDIFAKMVQSTQSKNLEEVLSNVEINTPPSVVDQLVYVVKNPYQVGKDFSYAMANPHPVKSNANDSLFTKGVNSFYNEAAETNLALQRDYNQDRYGKVLYDVSKPFGEALITDTVVGIAAPLIKPGLNVLASSLGGGIYTLDYATNKATQVGSTLLKGTAAILGKVGLYRRPELLDGSARYVYHTVRSPEAAQGVLNRVDPFKLNAESRFGEAFYLSEVPDTTLAELTHHNGVGVDTIRFTFNVESANILDLTDLKIAKSWGYNAGSDYDLAQKIAALAKKSGFNVIRYTSERGDGANLAVLNDFEKLLTPEMIVPVPSELTQQATSFGLSGR